MINSVAESDLKLPIKNRIAESKFENHILSTKKSVSMSEIIVEKTDLIDKWSRIVWKNIWKFQQLSWTDETFWIGLPENFIIPVRLNIL